MSIVCAITQARPSKGHIIHRRGMAKKKGGKGTKGAGQASCGAGTCSADAKTK